MVGSTSPQWGLVIGNDKVRKNVWVKLNGEGHITVGLADYDRFETLPLLHSGTHPAIKKGEEFNQLTVVVRWPRLEVYVNGERYVKETPDAH